jgi:protein-tyrosine-phosphatase
MKKILFICYGNVARSQMAEAFYNKFTNSNDAKSAGVGYDMVTRYKHPAEDVIKVMLEECEDADQRNG